MVKLYISLLLYLYRINSRHLRRKIRYKISILENGEMWSPTLRLIFKKYHKISVGYGSYGGMFRNVSSFKPGTVIGNYCSFAKDIFQFNANHPYTNFTTHPIIYDPILNKKGRELLERTDLIIGHDVWIGQGVIILPGVTEIGDGAIIGAGSIVTKNVPKYSIVVGNPARVLTRRFNDNQISELENSKWWELRYTELQKKTDFFNELIRAKA